MEQVPHSSAQPRPAVPEQPRYPDTFGLEPMSYERDIPKVIRDFDDALRRFEREGGGEEMQEVFAGVYPEAEIKEDVQEVRRLERAFDIEDAHQERVVRVYSLAFEYMIADLSHVWFPDCDIWRSFKFDDYKRQVDLFMDIPGLDGNPHTIALDVATGKERSSEKLKQALEEYRSGRFHDVKYFASDTDPDRQKGFMLLPRVIVGARYRGIATLARAYNSYRQASKEQKGRALERLRFHSLGGELYEELIHQITLAHKIMRRNLKDTPAHQTSRHEILKERSAHLAMVRDQLKEMYARWRQERDERMKKDRDFATAMPETPVNDVLEAVLEAA